ncbi:NAD-dependent epimerase, partial [Micrococcus sp. SIMBA_131]
NESARKGYVDGRVCRLPTISARPGKPNSAASSFASGITREPLQGLQAELPVPEDTRMWLSPPDTAVQNLVHALIVESERLG